VVTYIDSHACELSQGGYEVFLLMEFCSGTFLPSKGNSLQ
jgi:AP2-associated kinase